MQTTQTFFRPLFSSKLGIHGDRAGSLTAPRPNPDLVTVPLTAHPSAHPPLHSGPQRGAGSKLALALPGVERSQALRQRESLDQRGPGGSQHLLNSYSVPNNLQGTLYQRSGSRNLRKDQKALGVRKFKELSQELGTPGAGVPVTNSPRVKVSAASCNTPTLSWGCCPRLRRNEGRVR